MTFTKPTNKKLSSDEWDEMVALKNAMNHDITQVVPERMEKFTDYLVRSLKERGG